MSSGETRASVYSKSNTKANKQSDQGLDLLDHRLDLVCRNSIPPTPFVLAIQSRRQYHLSEYQLGEFKEQETGFKPEERDRQYLTFLSQGWEGTVLSAIEPGRQVNSAVNSIAMASNSVGSKSAAKKISIDDYNKRSSLPARSLNGSPAIDDIRNRAVSNNMTNNSSSSGIKRSSDVLERSKLRGPGDAPPAKKLKPSPRLEPSGSRSPQPRAKLILPPPLSPTLPAFVERLLSKTNDINRKAENSDLPTLNKKTKQTNPPNIKKSVSQDSPPPKRANVDSSAKTNSQTSKTIPNGVYGSPSTSLHKSNHSIAEVDSIKVIPMAREKSSTTPSVIVRLKIPRDRRKDIARLLRLPPKRVAGASVPKLSTSLERQLSEDKRMQDRPSVAGKSAEKRPREDDTLDVQRDSKRSKSPAYQDQISSKKIRESTPMVREEVTTPQGAATIGTPIPPNSASRDHRDKHIENNRAKPQTIERLEGLQKLQHKYSELGRVLKKESDKLSGPDMSPAQLKKFIASRIEVTLAFMLAYTIGDEVSRLKRRAPTPDVSWNSLLVWLTSMHALVNDHPYLSGLLLQLEAISLMVVWRQRSEIAEQGDSISLEKFKELRAQCEDAQRKFIKGSARLSVDDLQNEFPKTWKTKASLPLAHVGYKMSKDNLNGEFYLPLTSISLPIEGVRAGKTFLAEWCRREGVEWTAKLEF